MANRRGKPKQLDEAVKREWFNRGCTWGYDTALLIVQARFESQLEQAKHAPHSIYVETPIGCHPSRMAYDSLKRAGARVVSDSFKVSK